MFVGPKGDGFIGIEGAYVNLLHHHWGFAKKHLANGTSALFIEDGVKPIVQWIYSYMLGGEKDTDCQSKLDDLSIPQLIDLYDHATYLEYQSLADRVIGYLRSRFRQVLPNVNSIQRINLVIPSLTDYVIKLIADVMTKPLVFDYTAYMTHAEEDADFRIALEESIHQTLDHRVILSEKYYNGPNPNRYLRESNDYYLKVAAQRSVAEPNVNENGDIMDAKKPRKPRRSRKAKRAPPQTENNGIPPKPVVKLPIAADTKKPTSASAEEGPLERKPRQKRRLRKPTKNTVETASVDASQAAEPTTSPADQPEAKKQNRKEKFKSRQNCFRCGEKGHIARDCSVTLDEGIAPSMNTDGTAIRAGESVTTKEVSKKRTRRLPVCFNCSETGHTARNCTVDQGLATIPEENAAKTGEADTGIKDESKNGTRPPPVCYNCNEEGHIARNCRYPREFSRQNHFNENLTDNPDPNVGRGRNKNRRRARVDRYMDYVQAIPVIHNGEGITTCDREVRLGEVTRTGLWIE